MRPSRRCVIRFVGFELDARNGVLRKDGTVIKLSAQPLKALVFLASRPQELVTREELRQVIWGADVVVDFEHGLNTCIRQIRTALGDHAGSQIIETVPRLGYRFKATADAKDHRIRRALIPAAAFVIVSVVFVGWFSWATRRPANRNPDAVALYVKGTAAAESNTRGSHEAARQFFERAIAIDENYADPHAALARLYLAQPSSLAGIPPAEAQSRAAAEAARSLSLDPVSPKSHLAMAMLKIARRDLEGANAEYRGAVELDPRSALAHEDYGLWLAMQGRFDEALHEARFAETLDPLSPRAFWVATCTLRWARRYDEAIAEAQKGLAVNPTFGPIHHELGVCFEEKGDFTRAIEEYRRSGHRSGNLGHAYAVSGRTTEARELLDWMEARWAASHVGGGEIAQVYIGLGKPDRAFEWLSRTTDESGGLPLTLKVASVWDPLRPDPRFAQLLAHSPFR
jgi:DNA-binding winged helix-turn-helix (wHTH) protein/Tfp pilus assembly protein PilF